MRDAPVDILPDWDEALIREHGLNDEECAAMLEILGRNPTLTELGIFSVMWSEHCAYKSSRALLSELPTTGEVVICGPGENAGVIDIGGDWAAVFKMESHNHPSFIEPYQGAATGVGGILRDVFTMGARPVALLNCLRFGALDHPKTPHLLSGVVAGIGGYGNCMGIPTVAGETEFDAAYNHNILVNAMCVGIARKDKIFYAKAQGAGNPVIYVGARTGRDGIHGATMASSEFNDNAESQKPTVQVGDPFTEKRLLEACMELMRTDAIVAIQDMGAAGLTSSSVEMAGKGGLGIDIDLDCVPKREDNMSAYELMLSESQERMLMIVTPGQESLVREIFHKWDLEAAVIGSLNDSGLLTLSRHGQCAAAIEVAPLSERAPVYRRPASPRPPKPNLTAAQVERDHDTLPVLTALQTLLASPDLASKSWVWQQYDSFIGSNTLTPAGGNAAAILIPEISCALAVAADSSPRYVFADPLTGGRQVVAENWRNLTSIGAVPLAVTNNLNFGSPERPEIMAEFRDALQGMGEACEALDYPIVSGNVSFYNETNGQAILPTPVIGGVGRIAEPDNIASMALDESGLEIYLIGETHDELGASLYQKIICGIDSRKIDSCPPQVDLAAEKCRGDFVRALIHERLVRICHDISQGGLLPALAKMLIAGYDTVLEIGLDLMPCPDDVSPLIWWFAESQSRYIIAVAKAHQVEIIGKAERDSIPLTLLGTSRDDGMMRITSVGGIETAELYRLNRSDFGLSS